MCRCSECNRWFSGDDGEGEYINFGWYCEACAADKDLEEQRHDA